MNPNTHSLPLLISAQTPSYPQALPWALLLLLGAFAPVLLRQASVQPLKAVLNSVSQKPQSLWPCNLSLPVHVTYHRCCNQPYVPVSCAPSSRCLKGWALI